MSSSTDDPRSRLERAAMLYLDALLSADDSKVPLSPTVRRTHVLAIPRSSEEDRRVHGEAEIRATIREEQLLFRENLHLYVDEAEGQVIALWNTGTSYPGAHWVTVMDRFRIVGGLIEEIEVISVPRATRP